jgi:hypothetical protein
VSSPTRVQVLDKISRSLLSLLLFYTSTFEQFNFIIYFLIISMRVQKLRCKTLFHITRHSGKVGFMFRI